MFPHGADIAFIDEVDRAFRRRGGRKLWNVVYGHPVDKKRVRGIQGTLHLIGSPAAKEFFPTRKEVEVIRSGPISDLKRLRKPHKRQRKPGTALKASKR